MFDRLTFLQLKMLYLLLFIIIYHITATFIGLQQAITFIISIDYSLDNQLVQDNVLRCLISSPSLTEETRKHSHLTSWNQSSDIFYLEMTQYD